MDIEVFGFEHPHGYVIVTLNPKALLFFGDAWYLPRLFATASGVFHFSANAFTLYCHAGFSCSPCFACFVSKLEGVPQSPSQANTIISSNFELSNP